MNMPSGVVGPVSKHGTSSAVGGPPKTVLNNQDTELQN